MFLALGLLLMAVSAVSFAENMSSTSTPIPEAISKPTEINAVLSPVDSANGTEGHTSPLLADVHSDRHSQPASVDGDEGLVRSPRQTRVQVHISPNGMAVIRPPPIILRPVRRPAPPPPPPPPVPLAHLISDVLSKPSVVHSATSVPIAHYTSSIVHTPPSSHYGSSSTSGVYGSTPIVYHKVNVAPGSHFSSGLSQSSSNAASGHFSSPSTVIQSTSHSSGNHFSNSLNQNGNFSPGSQFGSSVAHTSGSLPVTHYSSPSSTSNPSLFSSSPSQITSTSTSPHYSTQTPINPSSQLFSSSSTSRPNTAPSSSYGSQSQFQSGRQQVQFTLQDSIPVPGSAHQNKHVPREVQPVDHLRGQNSHPDNSYLPHKSNTPFFNQANSHPQDFKFPHLSTPTTPRPYRWEQNLEGSHSVPSESTYQRPEARPPYQNVSLYSDISFPAPPLSDANTYSYYPRSQTTIKPPQLSGYNQVTYSTPYYPPPAGKAEPISAAQEQKEFHTLKPNSPAPGERTKATLKEVLAQDCVDAEKFGFCASPPRYPSHQVSQMIRQCGQLLRAIFSPLPDQPANSAEIYPYKERANREVWSWAKNATAAGGPGERRTVCTSETARVLPGYVREASSGRWLVVLQAAGHIVQPVAVDVCRHPGKPCSGLNKCSRGGNAGFRHAYKASQCDQRYSYAHLVTWDPDTPQNCPRLSVVRLPTACVCQLEAT